MGHGVWSGEWAAFNFEFDIVTSLKSKSFAASAIDTAKPDENQRLETRHVGASKRAFPARPSNFDHV